MELLKNIGLGIAGVALLYFGAEYLIRGGVSIAKKLGVSPLLIGLTLVAFGTSAPELVVSIQAALSNTGDIAVGNVVGSNIFNILVIMGIAPMVSDLHAPDIKMVDLGIMLTLVPVLWLMMKTGKKVSRVEGGILLLVYVGYTVWLFMQGGC